MNEREKALESILQKLIEEHFYKPELEWGYNQDVTLLGKDPELYVQICKWLPEAILAHKDD